MLLFVVKNPLPHRINVLSELPNVIGFELCCPRRKDAGGSALIEALNYVPDRKRIKRLSFSRFDCDFVFESQDGELPFPNLKHLALSRCPKGVSLIHADLDVLSIFGMKAVVAFNALCETGRFRDQSFNLKELSLRRLSQHRLRVDTFCGILIKLQNIEKVVIDLSKREFVSSVLGYLRVDCFNEVSDDLNSDDLNTDSLRVLDLGEGRLRSFSELSGFTRLRMVSFSVDRDFDFSSVSEIPGTLRRIIVNSCPKDGIPLLIGAFLALKLAYWSVDHFSVPSPDSMRDKIKRKLFPYG